MKLRNIKRIFALCFILPVVCLLGAMPAVAASILPKGLTIEETFSPGRGRPVGIIQQVQGEVLVMHGNIFKGYPVSRGIHIFKGDTIMTLEKSRVRFRLNDGSILSLAAETKLTLTKSVYQKKKKRRSSFFQMALGKARLFVVKVLEYKRSEFKVRTPTAVCGVRGSDFILEVTPSETIATALEDTELEFQSLAFLEEPPKIIKDFQSSRVKRNQRPTLPIRLPQDQIDDKTGFFIGVVPEEGAVSDEDTQDQEGSADDTGVDEVGALGEKIGLEDIRPDPLGDKSVYNNLEKIVRTPETDWDNRLDSIATGAARGVLPDFPAIPQ